MAYNLGSLVQKVQRRIRDTSYSPQEITDYINDTLNDIYNEYRLPFMQKTETYTVTIGDADLTSGAGLPDDFVQAVDLIVTTPGLEKVIEYVDFRDLNRRYPDALNTTIYPLNLPLYWYEYESTINIFPKPVSAYTVELLYYGKPVEVTTDDDVPELPSEFGEILVVGAAYRVLQVKDNYDQAAILQNKYDEILDKLVSKSSLVQVGTATRMRINRRQVNKSYF